MISQSFSVCPSWYNDVVTDMLNSIAHVLIEADDPRDNTLGSALLALVQFTERESTQDEFEADMAHFIHDTQDMHELEAAAPAEAEAEQP